MGQINDSYKTGHFSIIDYKSRTFIYVLIVLSNKFKIKMHKLWSPPLHGKGEVDMSAGQWYL